MHIYVWYSADWVTAFTPRVQMRVKEGSKEGHEGASSKQGGGFPPVSLYILAVV